MLKKNNPAKSLEKTENKVVRQTKYYLRKMGYNYPPSIRFTRKLNTTSAETFPALGKFTYNRDYIELNQKKPSVIRNLVIHEAAHVVTGRGDNDPVFIQQYQRYSGNKDPQMMRGETMEPPRFAYECHKCHRMWFLMRRPQKKGYCSYCGGNLKLKSFTNNAFLKKNWQKISQNNNTIPKRLRR